MTSVGLRRAVVTVLYGTDEWTGGLALAHVRTWSLERLEATSATHCDVVPSSSIAQNRTKPTSGYQVHAVSDSAQRCTFADRANSNLLILGRGTHLGTIMRRHLGLYCMEVCVEGRTYEGCTDCVLAGLREARAWGVPQSARALQIHQA